MRDQTPISKVMSGGASFRMSGARQLRAVLGAAALACAALPASALADHPAGVADGKVPEPVEQALGGEVTELPSGLYEVDPAAGPEFTSHGPDTVSDIRPSHGQGLGPGDPERPPVCATGDYYQHVLYAYRSGQENRLDAVKANLQGSIRRMNAVLNEEALASGGVTADYRVLCDAAGEIQVDSVETGSGATSLTDVMNAAKAEGFDDPDVDYTIFFDFDDPDYCGVGHFSGDERLSENNRNNRGGDYGMTYRDCWYGSTPMHENGHNQGAVQYGAPYSTGSGAHCYDENDVMCYADRGSLYPGSLLQRCTDRLYFDCGFDSYFDAAPEPCEYLATHWNMGSRLNRFIEFSAPAPAAQECVPSGTDPPVSDPDPDPDPPPPGASGATGDPASSAPPAPRKLSNRRRLADTAAGPSGWRLYTFDVPGRSSRLVVRLDCGDGCDDNLDLYLRRGKQVSAAEFSCLSAGPGGDERCRVASPKRGTWHIGVRTSGGDGGSAYEIVARHRR
jgi:hypothetical protein